MSLRWTRYGSLIQFTTYIVSNNSMTLYTGITNDIVRRVLEHKTGSVPGFTSRYHFDRLVWFEDFTSPDDAIAREKQIKGWTRAKKIALIKQDNPGWTDLSGRWSS